MTKRRLDESMNLLNVVRETALEPGYRSAAADAGRRLGWLRAIIGVTVGVMFAMSALQSTASTPQNAQERAELIARIQRVREEQEDRRRRLVDLETETQRLGQRLVTDPALAAQLDLLEVPAGNRGVRGPGVVILVDDNEKAEKPSERVNDRDLRQLVNGLWQAGAEAIAINGHRLSTRTAIRNAGSAVTVDYTSLVRPYTIEAIGDPKTLAGTFAQTSGASWWNSLNANYGLRFEMRTVNEVVLAADPGLGVRWAATADEE
ncbi:MAG: DUF881 domain-containing protein [Propionibacteriaceae bacterium]|nr:DUF881 domain-containing protein [Propionibacteriaceae bacterium]